MSVNNATMLNKGTPVHVAKALEYVPSSAPTHVA